MAMKKILVADDSSASQTLTRMMLDAGSYEVITASDGLEAITQAIKHKPDLILMDFVMPRMTGIAACRKLRDHPVTKAVPIIMVTSRDEPASIEVGFKSGCSDYLIKPLNAAELLAKVKQHLGG
jgi:CheY-like chemotaxis protein